MLTIINIYIYIYIYTHTHTQYIQVYVVLKFRQEIVYSSYYLLQ